MRVYLDNCCYNRPYDDQSQLTISLETQAKLQIQKMIKNDELELVSSYMLRKENSDNPFKNKREHIEQFLSSYADVYIGADQEDKILPRAKEIMDTGIKAKDAIHAACAIEAGCDYLITTDKRFSGLRSSEIKVINPVDFVRLEEISAAAKEYEEKYPISS